MTRHTTPRPAPVNLVSVQRLGGGRWKSEKVEGRIRKGRKGLRKSGKLEGRLRKG